MPGAVAPNPDEVAWHGRLTEPELQSALQQWRFTLDSHEAFSRCLAFRTARSPTSTDRASETRIPI